MTQGQVRWAVVAVDELVADDGGSDLALLTAQECARHARLARAEDRRAYLAAHLLVRDCVAELLSGTRAAVVIGSRCPGCGAEGHGRPHVVGDSDLHVSLSHSRGHVAAAAAYVPCGIDVEAVPARWPASALSVAERAWVGEQSDPAASFTRLWVRKEALAKGGHGSLAGAAETCVVGPRGPHDVVGDFELTEAVRDGAYGALALWRGPRPDFI